MKNFKLSKLYQILTVILILVFLPYSNGKPKSEIDGKSVRNILAIGLSQTHFSETLKILNLPMLYDGEICEHFESFYSRNPSYFPHAPYTYNDLKASYPYQKPEPHLDNTIGLLLDDPLCKHYFLQGDINICGDMYVNQNLAVTTGFNSSTIYEEHHQHMIFRCSIYDLIYPTDLIVPNADVWVVGSLTVGGSLYAGEISLDAGSKVRVGVRGMRQSIFSNTASIDNNISSLSVNDTLDSPKPQNDVDIQYKLTFSYPSEMQYFRPNTPLQIFDARDALNTGKPMNLQLNCPYLSSFGYPLEEPSKTKNNSAQQSKNSEIGITQSTYTDKSRSNNSLKALLEKRTDEARKRNNSTQEAKESEERLESIGDVYVGQILGHNGASIIIYGNLNSEQGVLMEGGASLYSLCGRLFTAMESGLGLISSDSGIIAFNGIGYSHVFQIVVQHASSLFIRDLTLVSSIVQVNDASEIIYANSLYSSVLAVFDSSKAIVGGKLDITHTTEALDQSFILVTSHTNSTFIRLFDGSQCEIMGDFYTNEVSLEEASSLIVWGNNFRTKHLNLSGMSSISIETTTLNVERRVELITSSLNCKKGGLNVGGAVFFGFGSAVVIEGDVNVSGNMTMDPICINDKSSDFKSSCRPPPHGHSSYNQYLNVYDYNSPDVHKIDPIKFLTEHTPTLFIDRSSVLIRGSLQAHAEWVEICGSSTLAVWGTNGLLLNQSSLLLTQHSQVAVTVGPILIDKALVVTGRSSVVAAKNDIFAERIDLFSKSSLWIEMGRLFVVSDFLSEGRSMCNVNGEVKIGGHILYLDERSILVAEAISLAIGDIFIEDRAMLESKSGDIVANGSIICQDAASITSFKNIISLQGQIISENGANIYSNKRLSAKNGLLRKTEDADLADGKNTPVMTFYQETPISIKNYIFHNNEPFYPNKEKIDEVIEAEDMSGRTLSEDFYKIKSNRSDDYTFESHNSIEGDLFY